MIAGGGDDEVNFLVGEAADLESIRMAILNAAASSSNDSSSQMKDANSKNNKNETNDLSTSSIALEKLLDESGEEKFLLPPMPVIVTVNKMAPSSDEGCDDEEDKDAMKDDEEESNSIDNDKGSNYQTFKNVKGHLIITTNRFLFVSTDTTAVRDSQDKHSCDYDLSVDAECIHLHAQSAEPISMYLHVVEGPSEEEECNPLEVFIVPDDATSQSSQDGKIQVCQDLFAKFSELISLNPISPNDMDQDGGGGMMGMMAMMAMGQNGSNGNGMTMITADDDSQQQDDSDNDDMIVASPLQGTRCLANSDSHQFSDCEDEEPETNDTEEGQQENKRRRNEGDTGATPEERAAMLERLDNLLVVKPGLEIPDDAEPQSQFEDADEDEDDPVSGQDNKKVKMTPQQRESRSQSQRGPATTTAGKFDDANDDDTDVLL